MVRLAANLSMLFGELPFLERFEAAARVGFTGVEYLFPYDFEATDIRQRLTVHELEQVLFNLPPGDWASGERGLAAVPGREADFRAGLALGLDYAIALGGRRLHAMAGVTPVDADRAQCREVYLRNLSYAASQAAKAGCEVLIEPINPQNMPGFFLTAQADAREVIQQVGADNLRLQLDLYHCQIVEGDLTGNIERQWPLLGHVQIAGVPQRQEPDVGEVRYPWLLRRLDELGYQGWVGCEYRPRGDTVAGLGWAREYGIRSG